MSKVELPSPESYNEDYFENDAQGDEKKKESANARKDNKKDRLKDRKERRMSASIRDLFSKDKEKPESHASERRMSGGRRSAGAISIRLGLSQEIPTLDNASNHTKSSTMRNSSPKGKYTSAPDQSGVTKLVMKIESDRKTIQVGLTKTVAVERQYLGVSLVTLAERDHRQVPFVVTECVKWLWQEGTKEAGVFLTDASEERVRTLANRMEKGLYSSLYEEPDVDVAVVASLLKLFFSRLPDPLFTCAMLGDFVANNVDPAELILQLSTPHRETVKTLFAFLFEVSLREPLQMKAADIGLALGPLLLRPPEGEILPGFPKVSIERVTQMVEQWGDILKHINASVAAEESVNEKAGDENKPEEEEHRVNAEGDNLILFEFLDQLGMLHHFDVLKKMGICAAELAEMSTKDFVELGFDAAESDTIVDAARKRHFESRVNVPSGAVGKSTDESETWEEGELDPRVRKFLISIDLEDLIDLFTECQIDWTILDMSAVTDFADLGLDDVVTKQIMTGLGKDVGPSSLAPRPIGVNEGALQVRSTVSESDAALDPKWIVELREIRVQKKIGIGGYAEVWKALFKEKTVAFKLLQEDMTEGRVVEEFKREMAVMSTLDHPNIVAFFGSVEHGSSLAMVLEYAARGDLEGILLDHRTPIPYLQRLRWAKQVAQGLQYLHTRNPRIIHRDIKSANILVDQLLCTKICDFGLAKRKTLLDLPAEAKGMSLATQSRVMNVRSAAVQFTTLVGTPAWTAPELIANRSYSEKVDVYSYGVFCWELMVRQTPHEGIAHFELAYAILAHNLRPPIPEWMPETFRQLMSSCWSAKSEYRPQIDVVLKILATMLSQPRHDQVELPF